LEQTNKKWFLNLSNTTIPSEVTILLQHGERFSLPTYQNKKQAIHEYIKDMKSNLALKNSSIQAMIRNIAIPQFHNFLKNSYSLNSTDSRLLRLFKITKQFCLNNPGIIFTRADKGNITVALDKITYFNKVEELLSDRDTYSMMTKNPIKSIENNLNKILKN